MNVIDKILQEQKRILLSGFLKPQSWTMCLNVLYSVTIFNLDLTHSDGIKDTLAVKRLPCGLTLVVKLRELPLLQRGVQNLTRQPHGAIAQRFTWGQKTKQENNEQTRPGQENPLTVMITSRIMWPHKGDYLKLTVSQQSCEHRPVWCQKHFLNWTSWELIERQTVGSFSSNRTWIMLTFKWSFTGCGWVDVYWWMTLHCTGSKQNSR